MVELKSLSPEKRLLLQKRLSEKRKSAGQAGAIPARGDASPVPATSLQAGLWFIDQMTPGQSTYNVPMAARLSGPLDLEALEKALEQIFRRQESLRTVFRLEGGVPLQHILPAGGFHLNFIDLQARSDADTEGLRLAEEEARRPMDLAAGPLFRASVVRLAPGEHLLLITIHHIITDGWSMGVLTRELISFYEAAARSVPPALPPLPIQFGDYARWQQERMQGERFDSLMAYWRRQLAGHSFVLELPTDHERASLQRGNGVHLGFNLSAGTSRALRALCRQEGITSFALLLAVFDCLLSGLSGEEDIIVGTPIANRNRSVLEGLIGYFVNQIPLRARLNGDMSMRDFARQVHETTVEANNHQELPFTRLVEELQPKRDAGRNPVFQVEFTLLDPVHAPPVYGYGFRSPISQEITFAGISMTPVEIESRVSKFDLTVLLWDMPDGISGTFEYDADLFRDVTIRRVAGIYAALLDNVSANPDLSISNLKTMVDTGMKENSEHARRDRRRQQSARIRGTRRKRVDS